MAMTSLVNSSSSEPRPIAIRKGRELKSHHLDQVTEWEAPNSAVRTSNNR